MASDSLLCRFFVGLATVFQRLRTLRGRNPFHLVATAGKPGSYRACLWEPACRR